jgi:hypothetical protein
MSLTSSTRNISAFILLFVCPDVSREPDHLLISDIIISAVYRNECSNVGHAFMDLPLKLERVYSSADYVRMKLYSS